MSAFWDRVSVLQAERALGMDGAEDLSLGMYLTPLNCLLKNGYSDQFCVMYFFF